MSLARLWARQKEYNKQIKKMDGNFHPAYWTQIYLLGLVSEVDEILRDMNWKRHRKGNKTLDIENLGYELADLTKYVISIWEAWGFSHNEMLRFCHAKSEILEELLSQEHREIPRDVPILITDIDGTIGDWRASFMKWMEMIGIIPPGKDLYTQLFLDTELSLRYPEYYEYKNQFEAEGGYTDIDVYDDAFATIHDLQELYQFYVIVTTARPADKYHRIWLDTWNWFKQHDLYIDELVIGGDQRILIADVIRKGNSPVIMFEDNPILATRAANSGIKVFLRRQPYNETIKDDNDKGITVVDKFSVKVIETYLDSL